MNFLQELVRLFPQKHEHVRRAGEPWQLTVLNGDSCEAMFSEVDWYIGMPDPLDDRYKCIAMHARYVDPKRSAITACFALPPKPDYFALPELAYITWVPQK